MTRDKQIHIRVTQAEKDAYTAAAKAKGVELSLWLRNAANAMANDKANHLIRIPQEQ